MIQLEVSWIRYRVSSAQNPQMGPGLERSGITDVTISQPRRESIHWGVGGKPELTSDVLPNTGWAQDLNDITFALFFSLPTDYDRRF